MEKTFRLTLNILSFIGLFAFVFLSNLFSKSTDSGPAVSTNTEGLFPIKRALADTPYTQSTYYGQASYYGQSSYSYGQSAYYDGGGGFSQGGCESGIQGEGYDC